MEFRQALFWDVNPQTIDTEKNAKYIIERVLDFGNDKEVRWLKEFYSNDQIQAVVENPRQLRPRTRKLWQLILQNN